MGRVGQVGQVGRGGQDGPAFAAAPLRRGRREGRDGLDGPDRLKGQRVLRVVRLVVVHEPVAETGRAREPCACRAAQISTACAIRTTSGCRQWAAVEPGRGMNRTDLQQLSEARVADAEALLRAERWSAAYYLLGYAVECGLKACAARQCREDDVPDKTFVNDFYTHRLDRLLGISGVEAALEARAEAEPLFQRNWNAVRDGSESSRYDPSTTEQQARGMLAAVADPHSGVLTWLKAWW